MLELVIFLLGSLGFVILSRHALIEHQSHGFPRFFAFEAILGLVVLNARNWFTQPFSLPQVVSWILLLDAAILAIYAFRVLRNYGSPDSSIHDASQMGFEKTTRLVTEGPYRFIRHPLYASLLFLAWGVFLKQVNLVSTLLVIIASLALFLTSVYEERENLIKFGNEYVTYMQHTKRFIPFIF
jgi:protein-S-isoprenylcysteine O-methyltransferase Ste14